jgi:hypothetical protein
VRPGALLIAILLFSLQIGSWNWAGSQCSCGQWVAPAMQFPMSKVMAPRQSHWLLLRFNCHVRAILADS